MVLIVSGRLHKEVGGEIGISEITVKAHRGQAMRKMQGESLAKLVRMAARLEAILPGQSSGEQFLSAPPLSRFTP